MHKGQDQVNMVEVYDLVIVCLNFVQIQRGTAELADLECLEICP